MKQRNQGIAPARRPAGCWPGILAATLALAGAPASAAPTMYRVVNLGPAELGIALNAKGQAAFGHVDMHSSPWKYYAWFYDGKRFHRIPALANDVVRPIGLNDAGQVTGISTVADGLMHTFFWSRQRGTIDIGTLPGRNATWNPAINNRGEIVGYSIRFPDPPPYARAFRWSLTSGIEDLGVLQPGDSSSSTARAINDAGMIAGDAWVGGSTYHAFVWTRTGGMIDIDTLGHHRSTPVGVSNKGMVAGNSSDPSNDNAGRIFWWTRATGMRELPNGQATGTWMNGMSSGGRIAGLFTFPGYTQHALTWTQEEGVRDINPPDGTRSFANAANNKGQVVGGAVTPADRVYAFVWNKQEGMVDLNRRLVRAPAGLVLSTALAIADDGTIAAASNAGTVLLKPVQACGCGHALGAIASPDIVQPGAAVDAAVGFSAGDSPSRYRISWSWGDGTTERTSELAHGSARDGSGSAAARHSYSAPGIYTITAELTDDAGNSATVSRKVVVAPSGGALAGSGSVLLPALTGLRSPIPGGKAEFRFLTPSAATAKTAQGSFHFALPGFVFASKDLRVFASQGTRAQLVGTGTLNGEGNYRFTATVAAGSSPDAGKGEAGRFGLKISHTDPATMAEVVDYDSHDAGGAARPLAEGRIAAQ